MKLPAEPSSPSHFDFLLGEWNVHHRRLKSRLSGSTEWEEFEGRCVAQTILGGFGNVDDNILHLPSGTYRAATIRAFDPKTSSWSIWWLDARAPTSLDVPVVGRFDGSVGTFLASDSLAGKPIIVRFRWTLREDGSPRWEQAFSPDGGTTWELNWVMDFDRPGKSSAHAG